MNERDREAVAQALRNQKHQQAATRTEQIGENAAQVATGQLAVMSEQLADNIVDYVWADALQKAFERLGQGDMGTLAPQMIKEFGKGITADFQLEIKALEEWHRSPKYLLPPSGESDV
ncbi:MAG: hypothetical protein V7K27_35640 [Nostoc sp.]|uniref:hypothetical protein n=1 Tax=Nostoc sp. TaxID=1180 RepID=UPI002FFA5298